MVPRVCWRFVWGYFKTFTSGSPEFPVKKMTCLTSENTFWFSALEISAHVILLHRISQSHCWSAKGHKNICIPLKHLKYLESQVSGLEKTKHALYMISSEFMKRMSHSSSADATGVFSCSKLINHPAVLTATYCIFQHSSADSDLLICRVTWPVLFLSGGRGLRAEIS